MYCTDCGKENSDTSKFCMYCGTPMEPVQPTVTQPLASPPSSPKQRAGLPAGLKRTLWITGIVGIVLVVLAGSALATGRLWLRLGANGTAKMMPAETDVFVAFTPDLRQIMRVDELSKLQVLAAPVQALGLDQALPTGTLGGETTEEWITIEQIDPQEKGLDPDSVMEYAGAEGTFSDFREGIITDDGRRVIWEGNKRLGRITVQKKVGGIDFVEDIQSWIGLDAGIGLIDIESGDPGFVIAAASRDVDASDRFLEKLREQKEAEGSSFDEMDYRDAIVTFEEIGNRYGMAFTTINRYVLIADRLETLELMIDTLKDGRSNLAEDETYQAVMDRLPGNRLGSIYIDNAFMSELTEDFEAFGMVGAFEGIGMGLSLEGNGAKVDIVSAYDTGLMSRDEIDNLQRDGHKSKIVEVLPDDVILVQTGHNLFESWRSTVSQFPEIDADDLDAFLEEMRYELGVDLEEDLFSKMEGEFALAFMPAQQDVFDLGFPVSFLFLAEISGRDQRDVEQAMQDIVVSWTEDGDVELDTRSINGVEMQILEDSYFDFAFGYGMIDDYLVVGTSMETLRSAADAKKHPLAKDEAYRQSSKQLPGDNHGVFYLDVEKLVRFLRRSMDGYSRQNFEDEIKPYLDPLVSISGTSLPADKKGLQRTVLYLQLADE